MSQPFKLYRLQQIDSQMDQARLRLQQIDVTLKDDAALRQAQENSAEAERRLQAARKAVQHAEGEVRAQNIKIEQTEASLYGGKIHNPKELQDLQKESASLKRHLSTLEDQQLEAMLQLEEAEAGQNSASQAHAKAQADSRQKNAALFAERENLQKNMERMENERISVASSISPEDIALYEQLRQQRRGVAVAKVSEQACSACGSTLTPALVQAAHSPTSIVRCSSCSRILYAG